MVKTTNVITRWYNKYIDYIDCEFGTHCWWRQTAAAEYLRRKKPRLTKTKSFLWMMERAAIKNSNRPGFSYGSQKAIQ